MSRGAVFLDTGQRMSLRAAEGAEQGDQEANTMEFLWNIYGNRMELLWNNAHATRTQHAS